jgi:hypothetical protein
VATSEIACTREGCENTFRVGGEESARCPVCGEEHTAPWPHDEEPDDPSESRDTDTTTLTAPAGATVRITIEIEPGA